MNNEKIITTYEEYKKADGDVLVKGMGRRMAYQGLDYINKLLKNHEIYCEEFEDGVVGIESYIISKENENDRLNNIIDELKKDLKTLWNVCWNNDTEMTSYQNEIFDKYYDKFHKKN